MRRFHSRGVLALAVGACLAAGCATGGLNTRPENIPALEQRAAAQPDNTDAATTLGIAYYNAQRYDDARKTLSRVVEASQKSGSAYLYLGLSNEELKDWTGARNAYDKYVEVGTDATVKERLRARLAYVARQQLKQDAKLTLEREQQVSDEPPTPRTVAVMPFRMVGTGEELAPLQTALSDMIITDLSVSSAITSVERVKIDAMIDEMLLAQAGLAEAETGVRVGRLLKAENVVQGVLAQATEKELRMDATVLNTARRASAGTFAQTEQVDAIFDLEKAIVFNIFNTVGVTLTASEREKINENRTGNLMAFLAYGRGLDAMDRGNYAEASTFFRQASQLDPNFQRVQVQQIESNQLQQAEQVSTSEIAREGSGEGAGPTVTSNTDLLSQVTKETVSSPIDNLQTASSNPTANTGTSQQQNQSANASTSQGQTPGVAQAAKATIIIKITRPGN